MRKRKKKGCVRLAVTDCRRGRRGGLPKRNATEISERPKRRVCWRLDGTIKDKRYIKLHDQYSQRHEETIRIRMWHEYKNKNKMPLSSASAAFLVVISQTLFRFCRHIPSNVRDETKAHRRGVLAGHLNHTRQTRDHEPRGSSVALLARRGYSHNTPSPAAGV